MHNKEGGELFFFFFYEGDTVVVDSIVKIRFTEQL